MVSIKKILLFLILLCVGNYTRAQMSEQLYRKIPVKYLPKNKLLPTTLEVSDILANADGFASLNDTATVIELDKIEQLLKAELPKLSKADRITVLTRLGRYQKVFRSLGSERGEWVPYYEQVIKLVGNDTSFKKELSRAYSGIAFFYTVKQEYEKAIVHQFTALRFAKEANDSGAIRASYSSQVTNYASLGLNQKALEFEYLWPLYITAAERKNGAADDFLIDEYGGRADLYINWYKVEKKPAYKDSAWLYLHKIPLTGRNASWGRELFNYGMGRYYFGLGDFAAALPYIEASIAAADEYNYELDEMKKILRGICLLKIGKSGPAKEILLNHPDINHDFNLAKTLYNALYEDAKKNNDAAGALKYLEQLTAIADSAAELEQRGKVFEITQKYDLRKKQDDLDKLSLAHIAEIRQKKILVYGGIAITLFLSAIIAILYAMYKKRQVAGLKVKQALGEEKRKMSYFLSDQENKIKQEKEVAVSEQRKKIARDLHDGLSGTLSALRFYIGDKRGESLDEHEHKLLVNIEEEVTSIYEDARQYMHDLYNNEEGTSDVDLVGFFNTIESNFSDEDGFHVGVDADMNELDKKLTPFQKSQLYLIVTEAMNNTLKHAVDATRLSIKFKFDKDRGLFSIADNGKPDRGKTAVAGIGLSSIASRISSMNGQFKPMQKSDGFHLDGWFPL